jgi:uncharacterized cupin superfamily protein
MGPVHWDDAPLVGGFRDLGALAGSVDVRLAELHLPAGTQAAPTGDDAEVLTYVLGGGGTVRGLPFGPRDAILGVGDGLVAGPRGLDVLAFADRPGRGGETGPRVVALAGVEPGHDRHGATDSSPRDLGTALGSRRTGLQHITIAPGAESMPPHIHAAEEELFVVLEGEGAALLGDERFGVRRGSIIARPAGGRVAHSFVAGPGGLVMLAYGQRDPRDCIWYPRSHKLAMGGLGLRFRISDATLDLWDGEPG